MAEMPSTESFKQAQAIDLGPDMPAPSARRPRRLAIKRAALALALLAATAAAGFFGSDYWTNGRYLESTDDAYVKADHTIIARKVSGYIGEVSRRAM